MDQTWISRIFTIISTLLGSGITWGKEWHLQKRSQDRDAHYLAVRVICVLDQFASDCCAVACDDGIWDPQENPDPQGRLFEKVKEPESILLPDDVNWKSIDNTILHKTLSLPFKLKRVKKLVNEQTEYAIYDDGYLLFQTRQYEYACLGLDVIETTEKLKSIYKIPYSDDFDLSALKKSLIEIKSSCEQKKNLANRIILESESNETI
ncbi:hypothetical protein SIID45300_00331 [Candidatus Magnetaquicoccaceae bacterium FCR-1]|uniref:Uncharacterized protein n=1 Tax=Candidatus Magnetaquiglobus chichijimensis TaxID=3141448 RepID=A0ABQ0C570_9PROT